MDFIMKVLVLMCISVYALAVDIETTKSPVPSAPGRTGRKNYNNVWQPPRDYGDDGEDKDDASVDTDQGLKAPQGYDYPNFGNYKGFDPYSNYGPPRYPSYPPNFKGYPYPSFFKGGKPGDSDASPDAMSMMLALNSMDSSKKPDDGGILSKLVSDPKSAAVAAIIPLSIVAAAVVPVLMNYMMTGVQTNNGPQTITTTATDNKNGRSLDAFNNFDFLLEGIANFARSMDEDECIQKTVCRVASGDDNVLVPDYVRKAATKVISFVNDDMANSFGVQSVVEGVKKGNCNNVCYDSSSKGKH
ncbi:hypothetical protein JTE90_027411 [Oedothorax gibbosus]|uniref:Uncharacterized protein n=1 Tax=Oedothorax gibbosus TaxID=931172 RepID=A0AAV6W2V8_9ARAC|nr:hypothetical protein JTE90_027411 [Oedothorax gibbosus]